jgi:hypothetical protein
MTNSQRLAAVRRCLDRWLESQHRDEDIDIRDAVLIRGGFYVGRKFELGAYRANWFMEEDELKVHDASGTLVAKFSSADIDEANKPMVAHRELKSAVAGPATASEGQSHSVQDEEVLATIRMQRTPATSETMPASEIRRAA